MTAKMCAAAVLLAGLWAGSAQAALVISTAATSNVNCSGGICTATAANAVLNAHDLMVSLAHGDTTLVSGSTAQDIEFDTPVHWASAQRLTLDSYHAITFTQPVMSEGAGGLAIKTNDGGTGGDFIFSGKGRVAFWNLSSSLIINGASYTLAANIATLASDIASNPSGNYAFANIYDASVDGVYGNPPIPTLFTGTFEGLGNSITRLRINTRSGLFLRKYQSTLRDILLIGEIITVPNPISGYVGGLVGNSYGGAITGVAVLGGSISGKAQAMGGLAGITYDETIARTHSSARVRCGSFCLAGGLVGHNFSSIIEHSSATGSVEALNNSHVGGLVGRNWGIVRFCFATGAVSVGNGLNDEYSGEPVRAAAGGLVGVGGENIGGNYHLGTIDQSYATGAVTGGSGMLHVTNHVWVGGLVGYSLGTVTHSYATGAVSIGSQGYAGGFAGADQLDQDNYFNGAGFSYSTGAVSVSSGVSVVGGFLGEDIGSGFSHLNSSAYWDLDTSSISDPSKGAGNIPSDPGITGLTTAQLQSGLPAGFDPTIWGESPGINNGLPYLLAVVP